MSDTPKDEKVEKLEEMKKSVDGSAAAKAKATAATGMNPGAGTEVTPTDALKKQQKD